MSSRAEVSRQGLLTAALVAAALLLSLVISLALGRWASNYPMMPFPRERTPTEVLLNVLLIFLPSVIISAFIASTIRYAKTLLLKGLILLGALISILTSRGVLEAHGDLLSTLLSWFLMFIVVLSTLTIVIPPPEEVMTLIYLVYGTVLGAFIGVNSPTSSILLLLAVFAFYDLFFSNLAEKIARGRGQRDLREALSLGEVEVGVGDIIFYSILASNAMRFFGLSTALLTSILVIVGGILTLLIARRLGSFPGLPIPLALGILPILTFQLTGGG